MHINWNKFKEIASDDVAEDDAYIYRGQSDATWTLKSSLFRTEIVSKPSNIVGYVNYILPQVQEPVEAWSGRSWNLADYHGLAEFIAFLQHNGFPTPLLDFTASPYIAAYFAFEGIDHFDPKSEEVSIYRFNKRLWGKKISDKTDIADTNPKVSIIKPYVRGNHKMSLQQGLFLYANISDIEAHIRGHEEFEGQYLLKYTIDVEERPRVIKELSLMGISAVQLSPSIESVCKKALEDVIGLIPMKENNKRKTANKANSADAKNRAAD